MTEQPDSNTLSCGQPLESHILDLLGVMMMAGLGGGCVDTYKALVEVAEYLRSHEHFAPYVATGKPVAQAIALAKVKAEQSQGPQVDSSRATMPFVGRKDN